MVESTFEHQPVLCHEVVAGLLAHRPLRLVDCTVGGGGHAFALLSAHKGAELLGLDRDPAALAAAAAKLEPFAERVTLVHRNFSEVAEAVAERGWPQVDGLLADFGVSSHQIDTANRGFSFRYDGPLDMRMDPSQEQTAASLLATLDDEALAHILWRYGEERYSRRVARAIKKAKPSTTIELAAAVRGVVPKSRDGIDPATRTFQGLRIAVNDELGHIEGLLAALPTLLADGGVAALISFHSLEDRLVKLTVQRESRDCICPPRIPVCQCNHRRSLKAVRRKPIIASPEEMRANPRSRSAKLRLVERLLRQP